jgi:hypothetical protein
MYLTRQYYSELYMGKLNYSIELASLMYQTTNLSDDTVLTDFVTLLQTN